MAILVAAIGLVGLLCLADLLLTFGVIRRLREHTEQLAGLRGQDAPVTGLPYGAIPEPFTALTASGERLDGPAPAGGCVLRCGVLSLPRARAGFP